MGNNAALDAQGIRNPGKVNWNLPVHALYEAAIQRGEARLTGGGPSGQAGALRHGIARAIEKLDPNQRAPLKRAGYLTRDPRKKERKKYGQKGARARFQFSKR